MFHLYVCVWCMCVIYMCKIQIYNIYARHACLCVTVAMHAEVSGQHWMLALAWYPVCLLLHMPGKLTHEVPEGLLSPLAILPVLVLRILTSICTAESRLFHDSGEDSVHQACVKPSPQLLISFRVTVEMQSSCIWVSPKIHFQKIEENETDCILA